MSDMIALLNDLSYIPPNNEQNEPIQEDIGETSNEPTQAKRNEFKELYASANEELYPGCDYVTRLDFMKKFTYFKVKGKLIDSIFNEILEFFQHVFPTGKDPATTLYYAIKRHLNDWVRVDVDHACVNECFLFRGDINKDLLFSSRCVKLSSWKDSTTHGEKVPRRCCCTELAGQKLNLRADGFKGPSWFFLLEVVLSGWSGQGLKGMLHTVVKEDGRISRQSRREQNQAQLARLPTRVKGKHLSYGGVKIKRNVLVELNWTKRSIFFTGV
ncbi:hypothetical protein Tco_0349738 [Tanacetum coccineum]